jgi:hypothetical protein
MTPTPAVSASCSATATSTTTRTLRPITTFDLGIESRSRHGSRGRVALAEIHSGAETDDNVVASWVPDEQPVAGSETTVAYVIRAVGAPLHEGGYVVANFEAPATPPVAKVELLATASRTGDVGKRQTDRCFEPARQGPETQARSASRNRSRGRGCSIGARGPFIMLRLQVAPAAQVPLGADPSGRYADLDGDPMAGEALIWPHA